MPRNFDVSKIPTAIAQMKKRWAPQIIWLIPVIALLVGLNLAYKALIDQGPTIAIAFKSGDGLVAEKTMIQYKGVTIGLVKGIVLAEDHQTVIATVKLNRDAQDFTKEDTRYWVVRPRITTNGVSGLDTLFSGPFIAAELGKSEKNSKKFIALEIPPVLTSGIPGREFILKASTLGSHDIGTQIYYRRLTVGEVVAYDLDKNGKDILMRIFIHAPYDQYVTTNSRFWNASGIDVTVSAEGLQVQTESLAAVVAGGIAFESPSMQSEKPANEASLENLTSSTFQRAEPESIFPLFQTRTLALRNPDSVAQRYVVNFKQSVKGLVVGAPVEFRGVSIGEVTSIGLALDPNTFDITQPVEFYIYPERLQARSTKDGKVISRPSTHTDQLKRLKTFIDKGLRAQLRNGSLLTGQQYIAMDLFPNAPKYNLDTTKSPLEMQAVPSSFNNLEQSIASIVKNTDTLIKKLDAEVIPELNQTLKNLNAVTAGDSPLQTDLRDSLREISKAASSMKTLTDMLDQQPQSLIFGKPSQGSSQ